MLLLLLIPTLISNADLERWFGRWPRSELIDLRRLTTTSCAFKLARS